MYYALSAEFTLHVSIVSMIVSMMVMMIMPATAMSMTMIKCKNANQIHDEANKTNKEQSMCAHMWWINESLDGFRDDR